MAHQMVKVIGVTLALLAGAGTGVMAQMFVPTGRDTLRGLPGVEIVVESLEPEVERDGLTATLIRGEVERRLRAAGIRVYSSQSENPSPAKPYLYVHVNAIRLQPQGLYVIALQVHLRQTVRSPVTDSNIVNAMTWDAHNLLAVPVADVRSVLEEIHVYVGQFISDWSSVH